MNAKRPGSVAGIIKKYFSAFTFIESLVIIAVIAWT
jgi:hypothetical protein